MNAFVDEWRRRKCRAFDLAANSTARGTLQLSFWGRTLEVYANANFSVYSAQQCNAKCPFCVEELRPASRGRELVEQRRVERDDAAYLAALRASLEVLRPLCPTLSVTGGEPSKDPRLPAILRLLAEYESPRRAMTTNASGLLDPRPGGRVIDHVLEAGLDHLNISRAAPATGDNAALMQLAEGLSLPELERVLALCREAGTRVRLSCVLLEGHSDSIDVVVAYLRFAESLGVDNVVFRQLMQVDTKRMLHNSIVRYSERKRVRLEPILDAISDDARFCFLKQIVGYYYYVEVWRFAGIDVVFEEADLAQIEVAKGTMPNVVQELIFHPNAKLCTTWQPWDGQLGPNR